jgi:hypothetical protein
VYVPPPEVWTVTWRCGSAETSAAFWIFAIFAASAALALS